MHSEMYQSFWSPFKPVPESRCCEFNPYIWEVLEYVTPPRVYSSISLEKRSIPSHLLKLTILLWKFGHYSNILSATAVDSFSTFYGVRLLETISTEVNSGLIISGNFTNTYSFFLYVSCTFRTLAIIALYSILSLVALRRFCQTRYSTTKVCQVPGSLPFHDPIFLDIPCEC